ncbi:hypothetical protein PF001_g15573 [Phytophthora fragariae]|uniref:Uncharacterized protein n=1 Tax=Phytophthora fragariae TaxID=53985 RepID=A0A6A3TC56_9STRA|nr:hypothetical protein PF006_g15106 [Phytophthora fragariae]KAE9299155.1 hypothetical protein PF001_g15573 [Phytophthora fragariae]
MWQQSQLSTRLSPPLAGQPAGCVAAFTAAVHLSRAGGCGAARGATQRRRPCCKGGDLPPRFVPVDTRA